MQTDVIEQCGCDDAAQDERHPTEAAFIPGVDIVELENEYVLRADLPGAKADEIDVRLDRGRLTLHARVEPRRTAHQTRTLLNEYGVGDFHREFKVGDAIDSAGIVAETANGVLTLRLPKAAAARRQRIDVRPAT